MTLDNGDIWVEFEDGSHLGIKPTVTTVTYKKSEPLPDNVKNYQIFNLLGNGGFASVYRGVRNETGQVVAIKMIDKKVMKQNGMTERVCKEVEIHSRLKHPSILQLESYFEDSDYVYLVLELCENGELYKYLQRSSMILQENKAKDYMNQIVEGVLYLHSHGILHRDLKLSNILLTKDHQLKIADFGLATQLSVVGEKRYTMCGTPNFISPEVITRSSHSLEADVWSLGCMLYTFLVGKPPFDTDAITSTLTKVVAAEYKIPKHLSMKARDLIRCLLQKNPKERISLKGIF
ncbi:serine/threonine-protein kinase PLK4-like [Patella vulgata]|uniref:serine/threonine-protein kinase PLK4-like n=1 Tax=Patella vulgata TaxID=6465 RepID=UPI0024A9D7A5|nr:serine/threonine-protein kinase PLK4-like [Patella vulgata]